MPCLSHSLRSRSTPTVAPKTPRETLFGLAPGANLSFLSACSKQPVSLSWIAGGTHHPLAASTSMPYPTRTRLTISYAANRSYRIERITPMVRKRRRRPIKHNSYLMIRAHYYYVPGVQAVWGNGERRSTLPHFP